MPRASTFTVRSTKGAARRGLLSTPHGDVETPAFMPVGTRAAVKGLGAEEVAATGARMILANAYHLALRPGAERIARLGGLHAFSGWKGPILTDSGGFQVLSLADIRAIDDDGVTFRSHLDGAVLRLTPEEAVRIQEALGADVAMALDECPPGDAARGALERAMRRTTLWARRCLSARTRPDQALFGIVQGGADLALRRAHVDEICAMPFDGFALGGLAVGEGTEAMRETVAAIAPLLPPDRPRYLMGVGTPDDLEAAVAAGIDLFDCVLPTRNARNAQAFVPGGRLNLRGARFASDPSPVEEGCPCPCCARYSRAYVRHLFGVKEMLGPILLTHHNLTFYARHIERLRLAI
jgi:queuine tRNA-ribosyltransferase